MPFQKKPEQSIVRAVRIMPSVETKIKAHCGTLSQALRNYAEQLEQLNSKLKSLNK